MQIKSIWSHLLDVVKAALAIALLQSFIVVLNSFGLHVPDTANAALSLGAGFGAIKIHFA